jgi:hypothetical protein
MEKRPAVESCCGQAYFPLFSFKLFSGITGFFGVWEAYWFLFRSLFRLVSMLLFA